MGAYVRISNPKPSLPSRPVPRLCQAVQSPEGAYRLLRNRNKAVVNLCKASVTGRAQVGGSQQDGLVLGKPEH